MHFQRGEKSRQIAIGSALFDRPKLAPGHHPVPVSLLYPFHHFRQRCSSEENSFHAAAMHLPGICSIDRAATPAEQANVPRALFPKPLQHLAKEFDVASIIGREPHRLDVLLDRCPRHLAYGTMVAKVDYFDAMAREFQIQRQDRAIVTVADWHRCKNAHRSGCEWSSV